MSSTPLDLNLFIRISSLQKLDDFNIKVEFLVGKTEKKPNKAYAKIEKYKAECKRAKIEAAFCDCSLKKIQGNYQSFDDFIKHEKDFIEIIKTCKEEQ